MPLHQPTKPESTISDLFCFLLLKEKMKQELGNESQIYAKKRSWLLELYNWLSRKCTTVRPNREVSQGCTTARLSLEVEPRRLMDSYDSLNPNKPPPGWCQGKIGYPEVGLHCHPGKRMGQIISKMTLVVILMVIELKYSRLEDAHRISKGTLLSANDNFWLIASHRYFLLKTNACLVLAQTGLLGL